MEQGEGIKKSAPRRSHRFVRNYIIYLFAAAVAIGLLIAATIWLFVPKSQQINAGEYQAVYLNNGQMYFGKLQNTEGTYLYLKAPYMPESTTNSTTGATDATSTLVPVKNKLWGPEDSIAIRADQVAFWQNLRDDSKVTQAIKSKE